MRGDASLPGDDVASGLLDKTEGLRGVMGI